MKRQYATIIKNIAFLVLMLSFGIVAKSMWGHTAISAKAQEQNSNESYPYPPSDNFDNPQTSTSSEYPALEETPPPTPSAPMNRLIVRGNGEIAEISVDPALYASVVITDTDGSHIVPANPGTGQENTLLGDPETDRIIGG